MNPTRLVFGVLLLSLCVFGLPEGCLVFASHEVSSAFRDHDTEPAARTAPERLGGNETLRFSAQDAE